MIPPDVRKITTATEAARARAFVAHLAASLGAPEVERARFLTALSAQLRESLGQGGAELTLTVQRPGQDKSVRVRAVVRPATPAPEQAPSWHLVLSCPGSMTQHPSLPAHPDATAPAEALLAADEETAAVLRRLDESENLLSLHREELHQTNQGVLALHAELDAAALTQQELLDAERVARGEAEKARRLLTFLANASAVVTASLDHEDIVRRLPELLIPEYASRVDVWLFDEDERAAGNSLHSAAAVAAARTGRPQHAGPHPAELPGADDLPPSALSPDRPLLCVPLTVRRSLGVLTLTAPENGFDADTSVMLLELARRIAIALDNALRFEHHR
ncbi:GAF domain-containing protein, partial [Streptomyces broussonetiae]